MNAIIFRSIGWWCFVINVVLDSIFLLLLLVLFALQQSELLVVGSILSALYALIRWNCFSVDFNKLIAGLLVILVCLVAVFRLDHGFVPVFYLFSTVSVFYAAKNFSSCSLKHVRLCLDAVYWIAVFGIAFGLILHWEAAEPLGELIPGSSTNGLPSYLIVLQAGLSISVFLEKKRLPILSALATLVVAVFGLGRGSIVVALLIIFFSIIINIFSVKKESGKNIFSGFYVGLTCLSVVLGAAGYIGYYGLIDEWIEGSKFSAGVLDPHRGEMLKDYLDKLEFWSLLFGTDYSGTSINTNYGGNPHNSYIRLHSYYGVFPLLLVFLSPLAVFLSNKLFVFKFVVFIFILFVLIRAVSEPILFPTLLDFFYAFYFFVFWRHAPSSILRSKAKY